MTFRAYSKIVEALGTLGSLEKFTTPGRDGDVACDREVETYQGLSQFTQGCNNYSYNQLKDSVGYKFNDDQFLTGY
ncbi:hypothetical protein PoB_006949000 [Plakobranchus ocellatus]|uniref:Uncharacterized protein n=1 Tax=Plakobranchus ocellatus TaxID=259542 RepID=A0AAV4DFV5_9GAST|nr:hypothetical protein PoB_006949000 [Plakobranchus ocellatus]